MDKQVQVKHILWKEKMTLHLKKELFPDHLTTFLIQLMGKKNIFAFFAFYNINFLL